MTDLIPWALVAILYALGGCVIYEDMKEADRQEPDIGWRFKAGSYVICVGFWPFLVLIIIIEKLKERRS